MSIKLYVVEDVSILRKNIIKKINLFSDEFEIVGSAANGFVALAEIPHLKPTIVITDIKMPAMSGLELIETLKRTYPYMIFVIITSYDHFDYAKQALSLQVTDYLLKPITSENIKSTLTKMKDTCKTVIKNNIYHLMLDPQYIPPNFALTFKKYSFYRIYMGNKNDQNSKLDFSVINQKYLSYLYDNFLPISNAWPIQHTHSNEITIIVGYDEEVSTFTDAFIQKTTLFFNDLQFEFNFTLATKDNLYSFLELSKTFIHSQDLIYQNIIFSKNNIFSLDIPVHIPVSVGLDKIDVSSLITYLKTKNMVQLRNECFKLFNFWQCNNLSETTLSRNLKDILVLLKEKSITSNDETIQPQIMIEQIFYECYTYEKLLNRFLELCQCLMGKKDPIEDSMSSTVKQIIDYIDHHYYEYISLNELADMFGLNFSYLSRIFKKYTGTSITDYITTKRVSVAEALIKSNPCILIKDVAEAVGYSNQYYFSKVFKSIKGIPPSQMLKKIIP